MSFQRVLVGVSAGFAAVMLTLAGYVALDISSGRDLTDVRGSTEMMHRIEQIHSDVAKNLARAQDLAEAARSTTRDLGLLAAQAAVAVADEPAAPVPQEEDVAEVAEADEEPEATEKPEAAEVAVAEEAVEEEPSPADHPPLRLDPTPLHGVATGSGGNLAILAGDVYRAGDRYGTLRVLEIHEGGVLFETAEGVRQEMVLPGWTPNRTNQR